MDLRSIWGLGKIMDMAYNRAKFIDKITDKANEIVRNLALIMCPEANPRDKNHWKSELKAILIDLMANSLKNKDTEKARRSVYAQVFKKEDLDSVRHKFLVSATKFESEGLVADKNWFESVNEEMTGNIRRMFEYCVGYKVDELKAFIESLGVETEKVDSKKGRGYQVRYVLIDNIRNRWMYGSYKTFDEGREALVEVATHMTTKSGEFCYLMDESGEIVLKAVACLGTVYVHEPDSETADVVELT